MQCSRCFDSLAEEHVLCFFRKTDKEIHLICKPERRSVLEGRVRISDQLNKKGIPPASCNKCDFDVGFDLPFAPKGKCFVAFGSDKVLLRGMQLESKAMWKAVYNMEQLSSIEVRDKATFFYQNNSLSIRPSSSELEHHLRPQPPRSISAASVSLDDLAEGRLYDLPVALVSYAMGQSPAHSAMVRLSTMPLRL